MALIGYARVSMKIQHVYLQKDALYKAGCERIFEDIISGAKTEPQSLDAALVYLRAGDTLVVWKLDRLGRSMVHLVNTVQNLVASGVGLKALIGQGECDSSWNWALQ